MIAGRKNRGPYRITRDATRALWSLVVRTRDGFRCQQCGVTSEKRQIDAAHILNVGSHPNVKYEPLNGVSLCAMKHHKQFDMGKTKNHDGVGDRWVQQWMGEEKWTRLLVLAKTARRPDKTTARLMLREELKGRIRAALDREEGVTG